MAKQKLNIESIQLFVDERKCETTENPVSHAHGEPPFKHIESFISMHKWG